MTPTKPRKLTPRQEASSADTGLLRLKELAQDSRLARLVAANPSTPAELLLELSHSDDKAVRKACTSNANTPVEALLKLGSQFPKQLIENPVFGLLLLEYPGLFEELTTSTLNSLLKRDQAPSELIVWASISNTKECAGAILMNRNTPQDVVNWLAENCEREASVAAKAHCHYDSYQANQLLNIDTALQDRDSVIALLSGRQEDFAKSLRKSKRALLCISAMSHLGQLSPEQYMIAGDISIATGLKWLHPRYRAVILETVLPRWSEYRPAHFDKAIASLTADERILAIKKYGWCRRNYKGLILEEKPCRTAGRNVLPSSQSDLLALSMQQPDHPDITELVYKLKRTNLQVVLNKFIADGLFPKHRRLFCAVMSHPGLEEESRLHLAKMASEKDLSLLNPFMKEQIDSEATAIKDIFMAEVDSCLARFCAMPQPGSLRLFALLHERSPVEKLARNVRSNDWLERYAIACNPSTPMQSLEILAHDGVKFVSRAANASWHRLNA